MQIEKDIKIFFKFPFSAQIKFSIFSVWCGKDHLIILVQSVKYCTVPRSLVKPRGSHYLFQRDLIVISFSYLQVRTDSSWQDNIRRLHFEKRLVFLIKNLTECRIHSSIVRYAHKSLLQAPFLDSSLFDFSCELVTSHNYVTG